MERIPQTYANHAKFDPTFHFVIFPLLLANVARAAVSFKPSLESAIGLGLAVALILLFFKTRLFALKVQDRVIRLEERLRMQQVLSPDLFAQASALSVPQIVALRFAPDAELPGLVEKALQGATPKELKQSIRNWRADLYRV